ncbi:MAG: viscotoxin-A3 [Eggerthellaceae bacterium]|nr:viscotoxin-A3 [Eggerthellaceae bacterium]
MAKLTDEQIKAEEEFMRGLPRMNAGAFLMPAIWGPAHGFWVTILYYPAWLVADNIFYACYEQPTALSIILAILTFAILLGITIAFAIVAQPIAAHRAEEKGRTRQEYLRQEKIWVVVSAIIAVVFLVLATWYNIAWRPYVVS